MNRQVRTTIYVEPRQIGFAQSLVDEFHEPANGRHLEIRGGEKARISNHYLNIVANPVPGRFTPKDCEYFVRYITAQLA